MNKIQTAFKKALISESYSSEAVQTLIDIGLSPSKELIIRYPLHRVISYKRIDKLCERYKLVFDSIINYIGEIPAKNAQDIADFVKSYKHTVGKGKSASLEYMLGIAAPKNLMSKAGRGGGADPIVVAMIKERSHVDDWWAFHGSCEWGVIVTAWGDEAADPEVSNPKNN